MSAYKISAIGAAISFLLLIVLAVLPWPFGFEFPGDAVLTGTVSLTAKEMSSFKEYFRLFLFIDTVFIVFWMVAWIGIGSIITKKSPILGIAVLVIGLAAPILDFTENELIHSAVQRFTVDQKTDPQYLMVWDVVRQLSYLLTYSAGALAGLGLWVNGRWGRAMGVIGLVGVIPALAGLFYPELYALSFLWYLAWFGSGFMVLWKAED